MTERPDHELEALEPDPTVPPRPEEEVADAARAEPENPVAQPAAGGTSPGAPAQGMGAPDSH